MNPLFPFPESVAPYPPPPNPAGDAAMLIVWFYVFVLALAIIGFGLEWLFARLRRSQEEDLKAFRNRNARPDTDTSSPREDG